MSDRQELVTPVGRLVQGSLYVPNTKDMDGKPLVYKTGDKVGQARTEYYFAIAIKKGSEQHWSTTSWGKKVCETGYAGFPGGQANSPHFSWKIVDGDSTVPNKAGTVPSSCEGFAGCWVLKFKGTQAPTLLKLNEHKKTEQLIEKDAIKPGDYIQVQGFVEGNKSTTQPGIYLNHNMICFIAYGDRISLGTDPDSVGFGQEPLPEGASLTPPGGFVPPAAMPPSVAPPVTPVMPAVPSSPLVPATSPAPYTPILDPATAAAPPPVAPPMPQSRSMTAAATVSYEAYIAAGWSDAQLIQYGLMNP